MSQAALAPISLQVEKMRHSQRSSGVLSSAERTLQEELKRLQAALVSARRAAAAAAQPPSPGEEEDDIPLADSFEGSAASTKSASVKSVEEDVEEEVVEEEVSGEAAEVDDDDDKAEEDDKSKKSTPVWDRAEEAKDRSGDSGSVYNFSTPSVSSTSRESSEKMVRTGSVHSSPEDGVSMEIGGVKLMLELPSMSEDDEIEDEIPSSPTVGADSEMSQQYEDSFMSETPSRVSVVERTPNTKPGLKLSFADSIAGRFSPFPRVIGRHGLAHVRPTRYWPTLSHPLLRLALTESSSSVIGRD
jgi:hypothetical protein